ncbi:FAD-dependent monooxygenase [Hydrogenovibrio halophilus]|uniref:FAD-dependent monooxygenase n=1 Tax=Hydrogenovibrio halophilus TaxID=373391 RepID=UPI00036D9EBB|nr:FAD-dependent monooxygenase [Hydrogenovibrio halophilus]
MPENNLNVCDALIVGGGPVGLIAALALAEHGQVTLVERARPSDATDNGFDGRVLALTYDSVRFLKTLGLEDALAPYLTQIKHVHVSQKGFMGITRMSAAEMRVPALGVSVRGKDLGQVLWQAVDAHPAIRVICPAELVHARRTSEQVTCELSDGETLQTKLLIGADGTESKVRRLYDLPIERKAYDAMAVITQLHFEQPHQGWAYERFTRTGPMALLPMDGPEGQSAKAVWVMPGEQWQQVQTWSDAEYIQAFAERMGERFGAYTATSERVAYPLAETQCPQLYAERVLLMGNAAHTQHPVAAQGLNLGMDDVQAWLKMLQQMLGNDWGEAVRLRRYAENRAPHYQRIMGLTDGLIDWFQKPSSLLGHARGLGLMAMEVAGPVRRRLAELAMGKRR